MAEEMGSMGMILPSDAYRNFLSCAGEVRRVRITGISRAHRKKTYSRVTLDLLPSKS